MSERCPHCGKALPKFARADKIAELRAGLVERGHWVSPDGRIDEKALGSILQRSAKTLRNWRGSNAPIPFTRIRGRATYALNDIADYLLAGNAD